MFSHNGAIKAESKTTLFRLVRQMAAPGRSVMFTIALLDTAMPLQASIR